MNKLSEENRALLERYGGELDGFGLGYISIDCSEANLNRLLNAARSEALSSPGAGRDDIARAVEKIILRRLFRDRIDGYTLEMADEIAGAILSVLSSPGGQGNGSSGAESAADRGPCPSAPPTQHSDGWRQP